MRMSITISQSTKAGIAKVAGGGTIALACAFIGFTGVSTGKKLIANGSKDLGFGKKHTK